MLQQGAVQSRSKRGRIVVSVLLFMSLFILCIQLGFWQLRRAEYKRLLQQDYHQRQTMTTPLQVKDLTNYPLHDLAYYRLAVSGYYDNAHTFLWETRYQKHRPGYDIISALKVPGDERYVLVDRGWLPYTINRTNTPSVSPIKQQQQLVGMIYQPKKTSFRLGKAEIQKQWPHRISSLDFAAIEKALGHPVYPFLLMLKDFEPLQVQPQKHTAYAVQWFGLAAVIMIGSWFFFRKS